MLDFQHVFELKTKSDEIKDATANLRTFALPIVIFSGCLLNLLSFLIMKRIRYSATSFLMTILSIVDIGVLLTGALSSWLFNLNKKFTVILMSNVGCKIITFLSYTTLDLSVCLVVIMTAERFYAVSRPLHVQQYLKKAQSCKIILVTTLVCASLNSHFIYTYSLKRIDELTMRSDISLDVCTYTKWESFYGNYWIFIDASIYSFVPFILLTILNVSIIRSLLDSSKKSKSMKFNKQSFRETTALMISSTTRNSKSQTTSIRINDHQNELNKNGETLKRGNQHMSKRLTKRLLLINISFCLFSMPISVLQILNHFSHKNESIEPSKNILADKVIDHLNGELNKSVLDLIKALAELLQYLNHGTNFFLYILSGSNFRNETRLFFIDTFKCFKCTQKSVNANQFE